MLHFNNHIYKEVASYGQIMAAVATLLRLLTIKSVFGYSPQDGMSIDRITVKMEEYRPFHHHHGNNINVEIHMFDGLVYQVPHGRYIEKYHEFFFFEMGNVHIPCYSEDIHFEFNINGETVAKTQSLSLYDLSASHGRTLPIELWDRSKRLNGWILVRSNHNDCFGKYIQTQTENTN